MLFYFIYCFYADHFKTLRFVLWTFTHLKDWCYNYKMQIIAAKPNYLFSSFQSFYSAISLKIAFLLQFSQIFLLLAQLNIRSHNSLNCFDWSFFHQRFRWKIQKHICFLYGLQWHSLFPLLIQHCMFWISFCEFF